MRPQTATILSHLKAGKAITARQASADYGIDRLAEHIRDLRSRGYDIETVLRDNAKKNGQHAEYIPIKMTLERE